MVAILDFGSQYTQLIARRVRELKVYCEIYPYSVSEETLRSRNATVLILSGGPGHVTQADHERGRGIHVAEQGRHRVGSPPLRGRCLVQRQAPGQGPRGRI